MAQIDTKALPSYIRSWIDWVVGWLRWAAGLGLALAAVALIAERLYNFDVPFIVAPDPQTFAWIAGGWWLSK